MHLCGGVSFPSPFRSVSLKYSVEAGWSRRRAGLRARQFGWYQRHDEMNEARVNAAALLKTSAHRRDLLCSDISYSFNQIYLVS